MLLFKSKHHWDDVFRGVAKQYGSVFTFWLANKPHVFITDVEIARQALKRPDFAGRSPSYFTSMISNEKHQDIVFTDYGHTWEALRRVGHSAAQKYSSNEKLVHLATDCVDKTIQTIIDKEGVNQAFVPANYVYLTFLNILAASSFGESYNLDDPEFKQMKYAMKDFAREVGSRFLLWEFMPLFRLLDKSLVKKHRQIMSDLIAMITQKFVKHYDDYDESIERDFCDALITAKNEALREGKESAPYLTDDNLAMAIFDLFLAGTDTSQLTFQWMLLLMTYYPEVQQKLRQEIESQIGDRMPTHDDRNRCHYVMAFISECLRFRNVTPTGLPRKAIVQSTLGTYTIPENTHVMCFQGLILRDAKYWSQNANEFHPERFLDKDGNYMASRPTAYIPFSIGRRHCIGERLAIADLFIVLTRFIQSTRDYDVQLDTHNGIDPDPNKTDTYLPHEYKIIFKTKN